MILIPVLLSLSIGLVIGFVVGWQFKSGADEIDSLYRGDSIDIPDTAEEVSSSSKVTQHGTSNYCKIVDSDGVTVFQSSGSTTITKNKNQ